MGKNPSIGNRTFHFVSRDSNPGPRLAGFSFGLNLTVMQSDIYLPLSPSLSLSLSLSPSLSLSLATSYNYLLRSGLQCVSLSGRKFFTPANKSWTRGEENVYKCLHKMPTHNVYIELMRFFIVLFLPWLTTRRVRPS